MSDAKTIAKNKKKFLDLFAATGNITDSRKVIPVCYMTIKNWRDKDEEFLAAYREAQREYQDRLEAECDRRAVEGVDDMVMHCGKPAMYNGNPVIKKRYSDNLLMFRLKKLDPTYRDRLDITQSGSIDHNVNIVKFADRKKKDDEERPG